MQEHFSDPNITGKRFQGVLLRLKSESSGVLLRLDQLDCKALQQKNRALYDLTVLQEHEVNPTEPFGEECARIFSSEAYRAIHGRLRISLGAILERVQVLITSKTSNTRLQRLALGQEVDELYEKLWNIQRNRNIPDFNDEFKLAGLDHALHHAKVRSQQLRASLDSLVLNEFPRVGTTEARASNIIRSGVYRSVFPCEDIEPYTFFSGWIQLGESTFTLEDLNRLKDADEIDVFYDEFATIEEGDRFAGYDPDSDENESGEDEDQEAALLPK